MSAIQQVKEWREFYLRQLGIESAESSEPPAAASGFERLIVVAREVTLDRILFELKSRFAVSSPIRGEQDVAHSDRGGPESASYAVWIRDRNEADVELAHRSADDLREQGIVGVTLKEHLLFALKYYAESGKHLDVERSATLCAGSRKANGCVPDVYWSSETGKLYIEWCAPHRRNRELRARAVIC